MKKSPSSIDGFSPRRRTGGAGSLHQPNREKAVPNTKATMRELHGGKDVQQPNHARPRVGISRGEIDESLKGIDDPDTDKKGRVRKTPEQRARRRKRIKRIVLALLFILVLIGGFIGVRALLASSKMFQGNFFDFAQKAPLKQDENGRSNILVFGTSEDSEGGDHPGGNLTDSIMVLSINQEQKNAYMISIPRDLWVKYETACSAGYEGKINAAYMCASDDGANEEAGAKAVQRKVGEVLGLDVQYYAHLNNKVVADTVDALGGVEVTIESDDPRGIYDPNFDWQCNHQCNMVNYQNGEVAQLDGAHALALARARNAQGGYGLSGGNFDREKNQQKIMRAIQDKAISAGTLMNFGKVTGLIDALGNNLRTNFEIKEVRTLAELGQEVSGDKLQSLPLEAEGESVVTTGDYMGQSIVRPVEGIYDYSGIASYLRKKMTNNPISREAAQVDVYNASGVAGAAQEEADKLEQQGFTVGVIDNAPEGATALYQVGEGNDATKTKLQELYGVQVSAGDPPLLATGTTKFVLIVGGAS
ncbi:MAG: LCP family protein [Candidatus Saccharimonadales bacterium]